jgi:hypothetical protein
MGRSILSWRNYTSASIIIHHVCTTGQFALANNKDVQDYIVVTLCGTLHYSTVIDFVLRGTHE